jgi:ubiquinone/menaquinone biosynthesis C-methylase UbiE
MSLERVLEPEVMDSRLEAVDYDSMDHSQVNQLFVADLLAAGLPGDDLLDLGTGTAQIPVELAVEMLDLAVYNVESAGLIERIQLEHVDAKQLPYEDQMFDAVISNSIVHHIPDPYDVLLEATRVVRPGGRLFFRDLMRPATDEQVEQLVQSHAGDENDHQRQMFDDSLRAALSLDEIRELVSRLGLDPATVDASSDRHWTWNTTRPESTRPNETS